MTTPTNTAPSITVRQIPEVIRLAIPSKRPVFLISNPGYGKTQQVLKAANDAQMECLTFVASMLDRSDFQLPLLDKESGCVKLVPLEDMKHLSKEHNPNGPATILYWNELNCSAESVLPVLYRWFNERKLGSLTLRDNVMHVADGNPTTASSAAIEMPFPAKRRFRWYQVELNVQEWLEWAAEVGIDGLVRSFISSHPQCLCDFDPSKYDRMTYASPAGFEFVSVVIQDVLKADARIRQATLCGDLGESVGLQLDAFLAHYAQLGDVREILKRPKTAELPTTRDALYVLVGAAINLAASEPEKLAAPACELGQRLLESHRDTGFFLISSLIRDEKTRNTVKKSAAFSDLVKLALKDAGLKTALLKD